MLKVFLIILLSLLFSHIAVGGDFTDYRGFSRIATPDSFESSINLYSLYPNSLTILSKEHILLWEMQKVSAFSAQGDNITALISDNILKIDNGICGGFVVPEGVDNFAVVNNLLIAAGNGKAYFYNTNTCAMFNEFNLTSHSYALSDGIFCEADSSARAVRNIYNGDYLYYDEPANTPLGVFGNSSGCYFIDEKGYVEHYNPILGQMSHFTFADDNLSGVKKWENGFTGFAGDRYFTLTFQGYSALMEYHNLVPSAGYILPDGGEGIFYKEQLTADFYDYISLAKKVFLGESIIYVLDNTVLKAYTKLPEWSKSVQTVFLEPSACITEKNELCITDYFNDKLIIDNGSVKIAKKPDSGTCVSDGTYYSKGNIYSRAGKLLYKYAAPFASDNKRELYKSSYNNKIIYYLKQK